MTTNKTKKYLQIFLTIVLLIAFTVPVSADHDGTNENDSPNPPVTGMNNPCEELIEDEDREDVDSYNGPIAPFPSFGGFTDVPVFDSTVNDTLGDFMDLFTDTFDEIGDEFDETQELLSRTEIQVRRAQLYLRLLCQKEYEEDHTLQHAWANLIGDFVLQTQAFVARGLRGNPVFLTSQEAYYQIVNIATARVFLQDVVDSPNLGNDTKRDIVETVTRQLFAYNYPTNRLLAPDDVPEDLAGDFYGAGGYPVYNSLLFDTDTSSEGQKQQAFAELNQRISQQIEFEKEKLAWGRGFFSYEVCDLGVYIRNDPSLTGEDRVNREDRRNCRITTPGSLIQDQTSLVFGSALRQMELNDEYEEWIAPNTLAVLSDVLSYRGLTNAESRNLNSIDNNNFNNPSVSTDASSPDRVDSSVDIDSLQNSNQNPNGSPFWQNREGPLPFEFQTAIIDQDLFVGEETLGGAFFGDVLDPRFFLDQIP